jgi:hypothetical protein
MGNLKEALLKAALACSKETFLNSNKILPFLTGNTQLAIFPTPLPIRTPNDFFVKGTKGNPLILNFPIRFNFLVIDLRAASKTTEDIIAFCIIFKPKFENFKLEHL